MMQAMFAYNHNIINGIQSLRVAAKKYNLWSTVLGGKVVLAPQKIYKDINITPASSIYRKLL